MVCSRACLEKSPSLSTINFIVAIVPIYLGKIERKMLANLMLLRVFEEHSYKVSGKSGFNSYASSNPSTFGLMSFGWALAPYKLSVCSAFICGNKAAMPPSAPSSKMTFVEKQTLMTSSPHAGAWPECTGTEAWLSWPRTCVSRVRSIPVIFRHAIGLTTILI